MEAKVPFAKRTKGRVVIGVDEAGRGPLAGPVVAAACVLGPEAPTGLDDSKKLSAKRRAVLEPQIKVSCRWALGVVEAEEIDRINIFAATMLAMTRAVAALALEPDEVLIDGNMTPAGRHPDWCWPRAQSWAAMRWSHAYPPPLFWPRNTGTG